MSAAARPPTWKEHKLPHPKRRINALRTPFVGNKSVDDNLREMVEVAIWNALGQQAKAVRIGVSNFAVELSGTLDNEGDRLAAIAAARATAGVVSVRDRIDTGRPQSAGGEPGAEAKAVIEPAQMICLRRFCAMDEPSTSAAIRQAVARLDAFLAESGALPERLVIVYSNLLPQTVTLDIGMPLHTAPGLPENSEFHIAPMPAMGSAEVDTAAGFESFVAACNELERELGATDDHTGTSFWQSFAVEDFRPWTGHPEAKVHIVPGHQQPGR